MPPRKNNKQACRRRGDLILQPLITDELQCLYNRWRDAESARGVVGTRRRNRSAEHEAKLAFKRKLGACVRCKRRKVQCNHWSLSELEDAYRVVLQARAEQGPRDSVETPDEAKVQVNVGKGGTCECERKNGGESPPLTMKELPPSPLPSPPTSPKMEGFPPTTPTRPSIKPEEDQEKPGEETEARHVKMDNSYKYSLLNTPEQDLESRIRGANVALAALFAYAPNYEQHAHMPTPASFDGPCEFQIGIGRQLAPFDSPWECVFAAGTPPRFCGDRFFNESELVQHFCENHHPIKSEGRMTFFVCRRCQMWNDQLAYCLQCGWVDPHMMEWWLCGYPRSENIENVSSNSMIPMSASSGSLTEGRSMKVKEDDGPDDGDKTMAMGALNPVHQPWAGIFTRPEGMPEEEFRRRVTAVEAKGSMLPGSEHLFSTPRPSGSDPAMMDFSSTGFQGDPFA